MPTPEPESLGPETAAAWNAYQSMSDSKRDYFSLLQALDEKQKAGREPSIAENLRLEKLLAEHDQRVKQFKQALAAVADPEAKRQLLTLLGAAADAGDPH